MRAADEAAHADEGTRGVVTVEVGLVHAVERVVEREIRAVNRDRDQIVHVQTRGFDRLFDGIEHGMGLGLGALDGLLRLGIQADVAGDIQGITRLNGFAER